MYSLRSIRSFTAIVIALVVTSHSAHATEKLRVAYPAVAPGSTPSWVTADKKIWQKYGLEVEPILVSGGARAVPALIGQSVQFLIGSDTGVPRRRCKGFPWCGSA